MKIKQYFPGLKVLRLPMPRADCYLGGQQRWVGVIPTNTGGHTSVKLLPDWQLPLGSAAPHLVECAPSSSVLFW